MNIDVSCVYPKMEKEIMLEETICIQFWKCMTGTHNIEKYFDNYGKAYLEGKCRKEGYVYKDSVRLNHYKTGLLKEDYIIYHVFYDAIVCCPEQDMHVSCKIQQITKVGLRALLKQDNNPLTIFVTREHNQDVDFDLFTTQQWINVSLIGIRFELNDPCIHAMGEIIQKD